MGAPQAQTHHPLAGAPIFPLLQVEVLTGCDEVLLGLKDL